MTPTIALVLYLVALLLAAVELIESKAHSLVALAVLIIAVVLVLTQTVFKI